ncbi:MAG TPA: peptide-methionine (S)-S-oxide reductase MsrA [Candidatus Lambdaproteobacteria bacterium]|nr:peptide-methionine (S)-S-oxide reductase MsrA [SAR324 cluster bacterium]HHZ78125.1 peptide-methionine (S)-S-oxide reductase MsrA [Candidatus Lambdaproteobacteria bacterium]HIO11005.1 peptide-methionine (S)-S-oxide reductase [Deltaproteobacteria bacterium]HIB46284.1 peptide-methionine (S)-S-oxide reductase MsrA [Candidatus Lambdaproteobacteria bacterium]HIB94835.1 peptide-methionine (S)-S-oxide reductase MsrA [Candidatus Lambdaproteobacteria bacterium]
MEKLESATLGGGCFWCLEAVYSRLDGVRSISPGYAGGKVQDPTYEQVCSGETGHAEVVQISFDPQKTSYETLLDWFWRCHDPTTLNRQGGDVGTQYRSVIFYQNELQKTEAYESKKNAGKSGMYVDPIVTEISALTDFYSAEDYHHDYYSNNSNAGYCTYIIQPKLEKLNLE